MNIELLEEVKQHILEEPNRLTMAREIVTEAFRFNDALNGAEFDTGEIQLAPPCGTAGCIAGWAVILGHPELKPEEAKYRYDIHKEAQKLLGVDYDTLDKLYYTPYWPEPYKSDLQTTDLQKRAEVTAARIDHFIATGE